MENTSASLNDTPFSQLGISTDILKALERAAFKTPTPIQASTIPLALSGKDIVGCAQTGTGKTAAFLIPLIMYLQKNPKKMGLVLAPTREMAIQICESAKSLLRFNNTVHGCVLIGGSPMRQQITNLSRGPKLIIGTPGRVFDHIQRGTLNLASCEFLILDEADQMLDMGFAPQIEKIVGFTPKNRQTLMFSATMPPAIVKLMHRYLRTPEKISVGQRETAVDTLKQKVIITDAKQKESILKEEIAKRKGSILIFTQTQWKADLLADRLYEAGTSASSIHGGLSQSQRFTALRAFKTGHIQVLVATDVASRGLHIDNISHVVNFELPTCTESFLHRIGRTARNGKDGEALTLVGQEDFDAFRRVKPYLKNCEIVGEFVPGARQNAPRQGGRGRRFGGNRFAGNRFKNNNRNAMGGGEARR